MSEQGIDWDGDEEDTVCEMCGGGGEISASDIIDNGNNVGCPACISLDCESLRVSLQCKTLAIESLQQTVAELREAVRKLRHFAACVASEQFGKREAFEVLRMTDKFEAALAPPPAAEANKHVCGLQGYDPMKDPRCPGCVDRHRPSEGDAT